MGARHAGRERGRRREDEEALTPAERRASVFGEFFIFADQASAPWRSMIFLQKRFPLFGMML